MHYPTCIHPSRIFRTLAAAAVLLLACTQRVALADKWTTVLYYQHDHSLWERPVLGDYKLGPEKLVHRKDWENFDIACDGLFLYSLRGGALFRNRIHSADQPDVLDGSPDNGPLFDAGWAGTGVIKFTVSKGYVYYMNDTGRLWVRKAEKGSTPI